MKSGVKAEMDNLYANFVQKTNSFEDRVLKDSYLLFNTQLPA